MDGAFAEALALAALGGGVDHGHGAAAPEVAPNAGGAVIADDDEDAGAIAADLPADLAVAAELAVAVPAPRRKYVQRCWQLTAHARDAKRVKKLERDLATASAREKRKQVALDVVEAEFPAIARAIGLRARRRPMDEARAFVVMRLAFSPVVRAEGPARLMQARAVSVVAQAAEDTMRHFFEVHALRPPAAEDTMAEGHRRPRRICILDWQWDETSQRLRAVFTRLLPRERPSAAAVAAQTMVQSGRLVMCHWHGDAWEVTVEEPLLRRALLLEQQTAEFLAAGLLRQYPVNMTDSEGWNKLAEHSDLVILTFCMDRASANLRLLNWVWSQLDKPAVADAILPHAEVCGAHGIALVRARPKGSKHIVARGHSMAALLRNWRTLDAFRDTVSRLVSSGLQVRRERRPAELESAAGRFVAALFPKDEASQYAFKLKGGDHVPKQFLQDLLDLGSLFDFGFHGLDCITHWCYVEEGSTAHREDGLNVGDACCRDRSQSVEKMLTPILNVLVHAHWDNSNATRWTYTSRILRSIFVGFMMKGLLPAALKDLKFHWDIADTMEAELGAMIAKDSDNYDAKKKLKLLKICQVFCKKGVETELAIAVTVQLVIDEVLYDILGDGGERPRASLARLLSEQNSSISKSKHELLRLMEDWENDGDDGSWHLFKCMGGDSSSHSARAFARRELLQSSSSLLDHFELRMCRPPYTLLKLADDGVSHEQKVRIASDFLRTPNHCLSLFGRRVKQRCSTVPRLLSEGSHIARSLDAGASVAIDFSERCHGHMRKDIHSNGRGKSFSVAANRSLCKLVAAAHRSRPGATNPLAALPPTSASSSSSRCDALVPVGSAPLRQNVLDRRGGNAKLEFFNSQKKTFKQLYAPDRPLTEPELAKIDERSRRLWENLDDEDRKQWELVHHASVQARVLVRAGGDDGQHGAIALQPFAPLWKSDCKRDQPFAPSAVVNAHSAETGKVRRQRTWYDPRLHISGPVEPRVSGGEPYAPELVFGCFARKKNVCRASIPRPTVGKLDRMCGMFNAWVSHLGANAASAEALLWLRGEDSSAEPPKRCDQIVLLVDVRQRPKVQFFARCVLPDAPDLLHLQLPEEYPYTIRIASTTSRLSHSFRSVQEVTSDDLSLELVNLDMEWAFMPLAWDFPKEGSLLEMLVLGNDEQFVPARPSRSKVSTGTGLVPDLFKHDPMDLGRNMARASSAAATSQVDPDMVGGLGAPIAASAADGGADRAEEDPVDEFDPEVDAVAGLSDDALSDYGGALRDAMGVGALGALLVADGADIFDDAEQESDPEAEAAAVGDFDAGGAPGGEDPELGLVALARTARVSPDGYVSHEATPWRNFARIGRITSWPAREPPERRSVSCKCALHTGKCSSPAKRRRAVSDQQMLAWLFSGEVPEPTATREELQEMMVRHMATFPTYLAMDL